RPSGRAYHVDLLQLQHNECNLVRGNNTSRKIEITFGLNREKEKSEDYGMMLYNKNRLIRAFERVGCQKKADVNGVGVIGIAEVDFLQPVHSKQDFQVDKKYK
ncbi:hypothetical protein RRG08_053110, partial [Elysia crispata]